MPKKTDVRSNAIRAGQFAYAARSNPYIRRFLEDEDLRRSLVDAVGSARAAYRRMSNGRGPATAIAKDRRVQRDLRQAADSLRVVSDQLRTSPKRRKGGLGRLLVLALVSGGVVLALSEGARNKVMDLVFGAEEEFSYNSSTDGANS